MDLTRQIASILLLPQEKVKNTLNLLVEENTIPFIARYRKEVTGNLDEVQIRSIQEEFNRLTALEDRKKTVLRTIDEQGKLTKELKQKILLAENMAYLEDLYQPFRPKRRTRAMAAREKGLEPLARMVADQITSNESINVLTEPFLNDAVPDYETALSGAEDIVAEWISDQAEIRRAIRKNTYDHGKILVKRAVESDDPNRLYETYYQFSQSIRTLQPYQVLAINRGERENVLKVQVQTQELDWRQAISNTFPAKNQSIFFDSLNRAVEDSANRLLLPAIARDIRRQLTDEAEKHAIKVFAQNLQALLTQPPLPGMVVLAIDPGFRTGSKVAVIDPMGQLLDTATIYPHPPQNKAEGARQILEKLIQSHRVSLIVIGNGTAARETELFVSEITKGSDGLNYLITSEAGASVYSASKIARDEFPQLDVSMRGAVSIGRRVQDPLAELVKIDPKAIGVGLYQHDINQSRLAAALDQVVESVVNQVGVEVNTTSAALLTHVAGIGPSLAERIVGYRQKKGAFKNRNQLLDVPGMGLKTYQQSAGFLRIRKGDQPLDKTAIHPESYPLATKILKLLDVSLETSTQDRLKVINKFIQKTDLDGLAKDLNMGQLTLLDIFSEIARPGRDPREDLPKPLLRKDILSMEDLQPGMTLMGTIRNVVDFGAFVDIGVKNDGLLHRSKIKKGSQLKVGDILPVTILAVDQERNRISLSMQERTTA
jgi:protein Tex